MAFGAASKNRRNTKRKNIKANIQPKEFTFEWKGFNKNGKRISGELQAASTSEARRKLLAQGVSPKLVRKKRASFFSSDKKITAMDIAMITRQIATMLTAGVPLVTTLELLASGHEKPKMRNLLNVIVSNVQAGIPLSTSLKEHKLFFDDLYVDLVAAGENSGSLDTVFDRIALYKEKSEALKSKIKKAMFYPTAVVIVAIAVTALLLLMVVPQFEEIFKGFGAELPAFTQFILQISKILQSVWHFLFFSLVTGTILFQRAYQKSSVLRDKLDELILKIPVMGSIIRKAAMARFARTLATSFAAGVPLIDGLESAAGATGNSVYRDGLREIRLEVISGMQINIAMRTTTLFPDMLIQMVMIGEESGALDKMLNKVANIYEMQVDDAVDGLSSLIEPIMMVVIGTLVGGLIVGMYLPIFQMGNVIG